MLGPLLENKKTKTAGRSREFDSREHLRRHIYNVRDFNEELDGRSARAFDERVAAPASTILQDMTRWWGNPTPRNRGSMVFSTQFDDKMLAGIRSVADSDCNRRRKPRSLHVPQAILMNTSTRRRRDHGSACAAAMMEPP